MGTTKKRKPNKKTNKNLSKKLTVEEKVAGKRHIYILVAMALAGSAFMVYSLSV